MSARITILPADPAIVTHFCEQLSLPRFIAAAMVSRGITTIEQANRYLHPDLDRDWHNPYDLQGMQEVTDALVVALQENKRILVFGDFDLDGISATALMTRGLRALGGEVIPFIPLRFEEGYGLSQAAIDRALTYEPDVLITVDNGIAAKAEVEILRRAGVEVIITDHHEPGSLVPEGVPLVDPKTFDSPSDILAGAGVALKVVQAVGNRFAQPYLWRDLIDLATLGTVADLMPMRDENRALVAAGVQRMNDNRRPCIAALMETSGIAEELVCTNNLGFTLNPRLNAAGRMGNGQLALDLLLSDDYAQAFELASQLELTNERRREIEAELTQVALASAEQEYQGESALVVSGEGWHEGVKGIVASRLSGKYHVPSILFSIEDGEARGSGRTACGINLFEAVESCKDLLVRFGGHAAAVGVTVSVENLPEFKRRLCAYLDALPADAVHRGPTVDAVADLPELTRENVEMLSVLEPYGQENREPVFLARGVSFAFVKAVGADANHLSCTLTDGRASLQAIMFRCENINELLNCNTVLDAVFRLQVDHWKGRHTVKAVLQYLAPANPCSDPDSVCTDEDKVFIDSVLASSDSADAVDPEIRADEELPDEESLAMLRAQNEELAARDAAVLETKIVSAFVGDAHLHHVQEEVLRLLDDGQSVMAVMGTGRGKSLTFQVYAIKAALQRRAKSIFVYPLRALIADQEFHLRGVLASFGLKLGVLVGGLSVKQRTSLLEEYRAGAIDVLLTTPESLELHAVDLSAAHPVDFLVIDEAHHVAQSTQAFRPVYTRLAAAIAQLGNPQVLALTATAPEEVVQTIVDELGITDFCRDEAERTNLSIQDCRNVKTRDRYLEYQVAQGEKTIIYVNSRVASVALARQLRQHVPALAPSIGFYNAGLSRKERTRIESLFRDGSLQVLVATSAFGEGVNIPNIRHVVLYHMPFNEIEFNQLSGRAGRDGNQATIHLLFGKEDVKNNYTLINRMAPTNEDLGWIYREMRRCQRQHGDDPFAIRISEFCEGYPHSCLPFKPAAAMVRCAIEVFSELGLLEVFEEQATQPDEQVIHVVNYQGKVALEESLRFNEGVRELDAFSLFKDWVLSDSISSLEERIRKPLLPHTHN